MLRAHVARTFTARSLTVTHALGAVPDYWHFEKRNDLGLGCHYVDPARVLTNTIAICNSAGSLGTIDVFCINYQGRLY